MVRFDRFVGVVLVLAGIAGAGEHAQWGQRFTRNMVSDETGLVAAFDPETGRNVKWVADLGSETWATPVIAKGRVFIGTNNHRGPDPRHKGDRALLLCLDEQDGSVLWQLTVPKLGPDPYLDWPRSGVVSPVTVEGDRVYVVTNRGEAVCLDIEGQANGNDGPYRDEGRHMVPEGDEPMEVKATDADILWLYDIPNQAGTYPHDAAHASILLDGDLLYINTSNGVDNTHKRIRCPDGPSLIVLDKRTGRLLARDREGIGPRIFHSTWSSPALGIVDGRRLIFFAGGDGIVYAFKALQETPPVGTVETLECIWRFDGDPNAPKENVSEYLRNREVSPSNVKSMPVFVDGRLYITLGGDIWWGKRQAWLQCVDVTGRDASGALLPRLLWSHDLSRHCCATPAVYDGLVFVVDSGRLIHCVDARTGEAFWTHETDGDMWASPLVADGKLYVGTRRRDFWVLAAAREKKVLHEIKLDSGIASTAAAANGVLYVTTMEKLYALESPAHASASQ